MMTVQMLLMMMLMKMKDEMKLQIKLKVETRYGEAQLQRYLHQTVQSDGEALISILISMKKMYEMVEGNPMTTTTTTTTKLMTATWLISERQFEDET
jgi:hypothetical protein